MYGIIHQNEKGNVPEPIFTDRKSIAHKRVPDPDCLKEESDQRLYVCFHQLMDRSRSSSTYFRFFKSYIKTFCHITAIHVAHVIFQQCGILTCVDSDEPVQPPFKLRNSECYSASSFTVIEFSSD